MIIDPETLNGAWRPDATSQKALIENLQSLKRFYRTGSGF